MAWVQQMCLLRTLMEAFVEVNKDRHLCVIGNINDFDRVRNIGVIQMSSDLQIDGSK